MDASAASKSESAGASEGGKAEGKKAMKDMNVSLLTASISEYSDFLVLHLTEPIVAYFRELYEAALQQAEMAKTGGNTDLVKFQYLLRDIPRYEARQVEKVTGDILSELHSNFHLDKVLKILFMAKSVILASVRPNSAQNEELQLSVPSPATYLHKVLSLVARQLFDRPSMIRALDDEDESQFALRMKEVEKVVEDSILKAVTALLPAGEIVDKYLKSQSFNASNAAPSAAESSQVVSASIQTQPTAPKSAVAAAGGQPSGAAREKEDDDLGFGSDDSEDESEDEEESSGSESGSTSASDSQEYEEGELPNEDEDGYNEWQHQFIRDEARKLAAKQAKQVKQADKHPHQHEHHKSRNVAAAAAGPYGDEEHGDEDSEGSDSGPEETLAAYERGARDPRDYKNRGYDPRAVADRAYNQGYGAAAGPYYSGAADPSGYGPPERHHRRGKKVERVEEHQNPNVRFYDEDQLGSHKAQRNKDKKRSQK